MSFPEEESLSDYSLVVRPSRGRFYAYIPDLAISAESDHLEGVYRAIIEKKKRVTSEFADRGMPLPTPHNLPLYYFFEKFLLVLMTIVAFVSLGITVNILLSSPNIDSLSQNIISEANSSQARIASIARYYSKLTLDDTIIKMDNLQNLALNKPTRQSSHNSAYPFSLMAVDGIRSGGVGFMTKNEENPWWQVDLQEAALIKQIRIFNPICCKADKLMTILLSDDGRFWRPVSTFIQSLYGGIDGNYMKADLKEESARYVHLQLTGRDEFSLDEVEIYGVPAKQTINKNQQE